MNEKAGFMSVIKKESKKLLLWILEVGLCALLFSVTVIAVNGMNVIEQHTGDDSITLYVKGAESIMSDATVQIGKTSSEDVSIESLIESGTPIKTLIMLDNSLSVPASYRTVIMDMLQMIIEEKAPYEEIAVATFDEQIRWLSEYTADAEILDCTLKDISYQNLDTYLTDVLYEVLANDLAGREENVYYRIMVISDGVDNKSIGYTKDELYALMNKAPIPIYTVGMRTGKNDEQLENMFAISRLSNADYFLLQETNDFSEMLSVLEWDQDIMKIEVILEDDLMDGSMKAVKIFWNDGENVSAEVRMPQVVEKKPNEDIVEDSYEEESVGYKEIEEGGTDILVQEDSDENESGKDGMITPIAVILGSAIICMIVVHILRNRRTAPFEHFQSEDESKETQGGEIPEKKSGKPSRFDKRNTVVMFEYKGCRDIILTDLSTPLRTFRYPVQNVILIGADGACDIVVDWDEFVSGKHCRITVSENRFYLSDTQSTNGTFVNKKRIIGETEIYAGNVIQIGDTKLRFEVM